MWDALKDQFSGRLLALSELGFWLLTLVFALGSANLMQYRDRKKADREWREYLAEREKQHVAQLNEVAEARALDLIKAAERAERQARANRQLILALQKVRDDTPKP